MRPQFELPDEVGATPGGQSGRPYRELINSVYGQKAAETEGVTEATPPWEMLPSGLGRKMLTGGSSALMAMVANPNNPLAKFIRTAYPKMYEHLVKSPEAWKFFIGSRRSSMEGLPDLWRASAGGATTLPGTPVPGADRALGVRQDAWKKIQTGGDPLADTVPGHEMQHAVQSTGRISPRGSIVRSPRTQSGLPAAETTGVRLSELLKRSGQREFASAYELADQPAREGLTQAAGLEATRRSKAAGLYEQARKEIK